MKSASLLSIFLFFCVSSSCYAQEYSYTHYDIADGLAGSVVYCITQDKAGFLWMGTETGVSRFDGTHFKTFTVADGLPDIEILKMFGDSKGRVWMAPFRKSVCYYYRGMIHNQENDSLLASIHLDDNVEDFAEDAQGNILILEQTKLHWWGADGKVREIDSIYGRPIRNAMTVCSSASGHFLVQTDGRIYDFSERGSTLIYSFPIESIIARYIWLGPSGMIWRLDSVETRVHSFVTGKTVTFPFAYFNYRQLGYGGVTDSLFYINEFTGCKEYNLQTGKTKNYLPGNAVSNVFRDATGNTWFTTMGQGVFRLNSDEFKTIRLRLPGRDASSVYAIRKFGERLVVGDNNDGIFSFTLPDMRQVSAHPVTGNGYAMNRILYFGPGREDYLCVGTDQWIARILAGSRDMGKVMGGVKSVAEKNDSELIVGRFANVLLVRSSDMKVLDTLWRERSTAVFCRRDTVYIGTLNGLYRLAPGKASDYLGKEIPFLKKRIAAIAGAADGTIWIATYDGGVMAYREGRVTIILTMKQGLTSNICRTLLVQDSAVWVGTNKGINKIALDRPGYPVTRFTSNDGLGSDNVNSIYAVGSTIYVGTNAGLSYFDQRKVNVSEGSRLQLLSILNSGTERIGDSARLVLPYKDKGIRIEYVAISYRSVGNILYRYRVLGLDTAWRGTKETFLEYPSLPSGDYVFQMMAINKFGVASSVLSLPFEVAAPFWKKPWFNGSVIAAFLAIVWLTVTLRIKRIRRRQEEKEQINHRLAELENTALQAQMNPHFIFNCLNSIQQYIFDHETLVANKYLTGFSRLIRSTLHNSSRNFISLADEIDYLSTYLSLEKLRFKEKMDYTIEVDPGIDKELFKIPPMLIQPFVENSMRHGLRHKTQGKGTIQLRMRYSGQKLLVTVEDNGIGRKKAATYKTREHIEYQSKGMSLTADRIRMMNVKYGNAIRVEVTDLEDDLGRAAGTRVVLEFPIFHLATQKEFI
jgi:ligand-binding sensor domain-containing protein